MVARNSWTQMADPNSKLSVFKVLINLGHQAQDISSPYYPQSNGRAELGVKTAKRLLKNNINQDGTLNNDNVARAILQYHNTPLRDGPMSPAQLLFGRALADFLPVNPDAYQLHPYWCENINKRQIQQSATRKKTNQEV